MRLENIEGIYPLGPMQSGILAEAVSGGAAGLYCEQALLEIDESLDLQALREAWGDVLDQHAILRTAFAWEDLPEPLQVALRKVEARVEAEDLRELSDDERQIRLQETLDSERRRGFELMRAPLARLRWIRWAQAQCRVLLTFHHLLLDGWSLSIVLGDLYICYRSRIEGRRAPLLAPRPFQDFIAWSAGLSKEAFEAHWTATLRGFTQPTLLAEAFFCRAGAAVGHAEAVRRLDEVATAQLNATARLQHLTLNVIVQGAWALALSRYTGARDVMFGVTVSGRPPELAGVESMVGLFINTLPLRVDVAPGARVKDWLRSLQQMNFKVREIEQLPPGRIRKFAEVPGGQPLFDSIVVFENYADEHSVVRLSEGRWRPWIRPLQLTAYPLHLMVAPEERLRLHLTYDNGVVETAAAETLMERFEHLLKEICANPDGLIGDLSLLNDAERGRWLEDCGCVCDYPRGHVVELFGEQARRTPDAIAVRGAGETVSYGELDRRSDRLAQALRRRGVERERIVALVGERGIGFVTAMLAVWKAGGAYLPILPDEPRRAEMLDSAHLVLAWGEAVASWRDCGVAVVDRAALERESGIDAALGRSGEGALAYVLYTSGSTGRPKGALIEQRGMVNHLYAKIEALGLTSRDVVAQSATQTFDISVWQCLAALLAGGQVAVIGEEEARDPARLWRAVARDGVTVLETVPLMLEALLGCEGPAGGLKWMIPTGEALAPELCRRWLQRHPEIPVMNAYGPTECSDDVTHHVARTAPEAGLLQMPIGRPIGNLRAYVLDEGLDPVGPGMAGELYIGGAGVCRGYLGRADLTAERFLPDPYGAAGERMYRTGDRARRRGDGELVYLGRLDDQVKIRGHRIEPGEVEAALLAEPGVRQAVVLALGEGGAKRLVAYVVGEGLSGPDLRERLRRRLPDWLTPSAVVTLAELPRTANGKIDRRALPTPTPEPSRVPAEGLERLLADLWEAVLERRGIGARDNFFELGGDSILSLQIVSRARQRGVRLTPRQVFEHQTIEALAQVALREEDAAPAGPEVGPAPLTPIQRWLTEQELGDPDHWNMAVMVRPREPIDAARLEAAVRQVTAHHGALRLRFDGSVQREAAEAREVFEAVAGAWDAAATQRSLRLSEGPVFKAVWLVEKGRLALVAHHLAVDGVSWRVILEDLEAAYEGRTLAPAAPSYVAWARRLTEQAATGEWRGELAYWRGQPWGEIGPLPVDGEGTNEEGTARTLRREWDEARTRALLEEGPTRWRAQIQETLLTALVRALCGWTGRGAALVAVEGHGRTGIEDLEPTRTVGWFTALYPLVLRGGGSAGEALAEVRARLRGVPGGGQGWGALRYLDAESGLEGFAEPEVSFNYLGRIGGEPGALFTFADEATGPWRAASARRRFLIDFNAVVVDRRLQVHWTYSPARHNPDTIERLAKSFEDEMAGLDSGAALRSDAQSDYLEATR